VFPKKTKFMKKIEVYTNCDNKDYLTNEYNIIQDEECLTEMSRSISNDWTNPGEKIATCLEENDKYKIEINGKKISLGVEEIHELFILFGIVQDMGKIEYRESKLIKSIG